MGILCSTSAIGLFCAFTIPIKGAVRRWKESECGALERVNHCMGQTVKVHGSKYGGRKGMEMQGE